MGSFFPRDFVGGNARFQNVQSHDVADRVVQHQRQEVELHHPVKPLGELMKKRRQIALLRDGLTHFQQRLQLAPGVVQRLYLRNFRGRNSRVRHNRQDSIRLLVPQPAACLKVGLIARFSYTSIKCECSLEIQTR